jgi:hypothetical protein
VPESATIVTRTAYPVEPRQVSLLRTLPLGSSGTEMLTRELNKRGAELDSAFVSDRTLLLAGGPALIELFERSRDCCATGLVAGSCRV